MRGDRPHQLPPSIVGRLFTPHARGSTVVETIFSAIVDVYPACAGIDRWQPLQAACQDGLPRMRGDRPGSLFVLMLLLEFTPHARGSTEGWDLADVARDVYPACAGIDP